MLKKYFLAAALFSGVLVQVSCKKDYTDIQTTDQQAIDAFVAKNTGYTADDSGYYYKINSQGTGAAVTNSDSVFYSYTFKTLAGATLYSSPVNGNQSNLLGYVDRFAINSAIYTISPFRLAMAKLNRGGAVSLVIPSHLAFGKNGIANFNIGSNENLLVEINTLTQSTQGAIDEQRIKDFIQAKALTNVVKDESGVYYQILTQGTGTDVIDEHSTIVADYAGRLLDGTQFDAGTDLSFSTTTVISGWGKVMPKFKAGSKVRLLIPSWLAYGISGSGAIPPNAVLDFDVTVKTVTN